MKTPIIIIAAMTIGGAAFAQNQPMNPPSAMAPGDPAPSPAAPPMASPAPMASDAPMQPPQQPMGMPSSATPMAGGGESASYPVCSRTVTNKCRNRGGR